MHRAEPNPAIAEATRAQLAAADPRRSTWVSANAGSGKTRVLINRVARLLLAGCPPQKILCLTYTKAAAAEMQNRLFRSLGKWAMLPEAALRAELAALGETRVDDARLRLARTLFARALETPGGLKIQTIHAFCGHILRRFPLEAGVSPRLEEMDERKARLLQREVLEEIAEQQPALFDDLARHLSEESSDSLAASILQQRDAFSDGVDPAALARALGHADVEPDEVLLARVLHGLDDAALDTLAGALATGGKIGRAVAAKLQQGLPEAAGAALDLLVDVLLTKKFTLDSRLTTKDVRAAYPWVTEMLATLAQRLNTALEARRVRASVLPACALGRFAQAFLSRYGARKLALGRIDFDDMIRLTRDLLTRSEMAAWVLYRLDGGIEHILVDEAQDTAPAQWDIVRMLAEEFHAGNAERAHPRTVFVVGDEKQSIYSFQGADPSGFDRMRRHFAARLELEGETLLRADLLHSFRSAPPVLQLVDAVFRDPAIAGVSDDIRHRTVHTDMPGRVELWPFVERQDEEVEQVWYDPVDTPRKQAPELRLAQIVAARVAQMLDSGTLLPDPEDGALRPVRAEDILILVQRRKTLFHALIKELKARGVEVAGADRLKIIEELAVRDLLSLLRFLDQPADDLALAEVLRSPLGGVSEQQLFTLAHNRKGTLWQAVQQGGAACAGLRDMLSSLLAQVDFLRPYELLETVLGAWDGRRRLVARLGAEATDGIDELLNQALAYESVEAPVLTGFLDWITADDVEVKRQLESGNGQVRVMTVHGAKGLESPVVILPETGPRVFHTNAPLVVGLNGQAFLQGTKDTRPAPLQTQETARQQRLSEESGRLLYVALTRARNWLIVCGAGTTAPDKGNSWYEKVAAAMDDCAAQPAPAPQGLHGEMRVLAHNMDLAAGGAKTPTPETAPAPLPECLTQPLPPPQRRGRLLSPSDLSGAHALAPDMSLDGGGTEVADADAAMQRGTLIHLLLETLPALPQADWPATIATLLPADTPPDVADEALRVLRSPELSHIFTPDALVEVALTAPLDALEGARILGRIDRLLITETRVLAVDFKSNREVPATPDAVPEGILRQMGAYAAALAQIYPEHRIATAILWTANAKFMELPANVTDAALRRAGQS